LLLEQAARKAKAEAIERERSKRIRNYFTDTLKSHGYKSPHEYIQTTNQMKARLEIEGKKADLDPDQIEMIEISERLATMRIKREGLTGYRDIIPVCLKSCDVITVGVSAPVLRLAK